MINTVEKWQKFLSKWSKDWLSTKEKFPSSIRKKEWFGYKPASEKQISNLENKLGYNLPPSFRTFLLTTNGWRRTSTFIQRIRPVSKIEWLQVEDPDQINGWEELIEEEFGEYGGVSKEEYYSYTETSSGYFDKTHFQTSIVIANPIPGDTATYLLNPMVVTEDGEWEAWFSAHWIPGVRRYPSFGHLMMDQYQSFLRLELKRKRNLEYIGPFKGVYAPDRPRSKAILIGPGKPTPKPMTIEVLVEKLNDPSENIRKDAVEKAYKRFKPHDPTDERPSLQPQLLEILYSNMETEVRIAATLLLGSFGNQDAIKPLVTALQDSDIGGAALSALNYLNMHYKSPEIADGILNYLLAERDYSSISTGLHILEDYKDKRIESIALRILEDYKNNEKQPLFQAAFLIARFSDNAVVQLTEMLKHHSPAIREVAAGSLRETKDSSAIPALEAVLNDEDPNVRQQAEMSILFLK